MTNEREFLDLFLRIKNRGFIKSNRKGNTGIGKTFEDCCGITENNSQLPDFKNIELKSQREYTGSYLTLFTKSPSSPRSANTMLRMNFGSFDKMNSDVKILHTSIYANSFNNHISGYGYKLQVDRQEEKIYILVKSLRENIIVSNEIYWTFGDLKRKVDTKLSLVAYISAETKKINNHEEFWFNKAILLSGLNFEKFINLLEEGKVMVDIRAGSYKQGDKKGKTHDHGTAFRIAKKDLKYFFNIETIE